MNNFCLNLRCLLLILGGAFWIITLPGGPYCQAAELSSHQKFVREIYQELIEINTTHSSGDTTKAAQAMAARLKAGGFPADEIQILGPHPQKGNLVARLRGSGLHKPILLLAHLDVVEANREDWSVDPFRLLERDGYFYGRGTVDDKAMAAIWIANFIRFKQEGFVPNCDFIVALTAEEEGGQDEFNGVKWLLANHRKLIDAEYCINEGGGGEIKNGNHLLNEVQASEKIYLSFRLEVKNRGGHSSLPTKDNAIYRLAAGLVRLSKFEFPVKLDEITRAYFKRMAKIEKGQTAEDMELVARTPPDPGASSRLAATPFYNALMRTTWVATMVEAGHAENALPQTARAVVNCRILPTDAPDEVERTLVTVLADDQIRISRIQEPVISPPSPLKPKVVQAVERVTEQMWPGVPVVPMMSTGASDGAYLRNAGIPAYGVSGIFEDIDDLRWHGKDERVGVKEFYDGHEFLYRLIKMLASEG